MPLAELARRPKVRRWLGIAAAAVAVHALIGVFAVPPLLRSLLAGKLTQALHRRTTVEAVSFNPFALAVHELKVADGTVLFSDAAVKPPFAATLRAVELGVRSFSTAPNAAATVELSLATDADETLRETGELTFAPLAAHGTVEVAGLPLRRYAAYYRDAVAFEVRDGVLGLPTGYA